MNKYKGFSRKAQEKMRQRRSCTQKVRFESEDVAYQKGQRSYHCRYCDGWHRTGSLITQIRSRRY